MNVVDKFYILLPRRDAREAAKRDEVVQALLAIIWEQDCKIDFLSQEVLHLSGKISQSQAKTSTQVDS